MGISADIGFLVGASETGVSKSRGKRVGDAGAENTRHLISSLPHQIRGNIMLINTKQKAKI